jgi:ubiquinol-cytochrome c reductase iron-sulfur subunit
MSDSLPTSRPSDDSTAETEASADRQRRNFLLAATSTVGGLYVVAAAVPFVRSMSPSERALAAGAPVEAPIGGMEPGQLRVVEWRGKPVWVFRRSEEMVAQLGKHDGLLADPQSETQQQPDYCRNATRSIRPEYFIATGICTHLGCSPTLRTDIGAAELGADWPGGFFCPCHGSKFDLAGRVFKGVPAPTNLEIPPHRYDGDARLVIGEDNTKKA